MPNTCSRSRRASTASVAVSVRRFVPLKIQPCSPFRICRTVTCGDALTTINLSGDDKVISFGQLRFCEAARVPFMKIVLVLTAFEPPTACRYRANTSLTVGRVRDDAAGAVGFGSGSCPDFARGIRSEEHTSELQSLRH